jgi:hypothetical protein
VAQPGQDILITGKIINDGLRLGTAYVVVLIADPYNHNRIIFDSDRDLEEPFKRSLRIVDIPRLGESSFALTWSIPKQIESGVYDIKVQIWNPPKLFKKKTKQFHPFLFHETSWSGLFEVAEELAPNENQRRAKPKAFISYAWFTEAHQVWVQEFADELVKNGIEVVLDKRNLFPGEEITHFIERGISTCDFMILVCSEEYTRKANEREGGVGMEAVVGSSSYFNTKDKRRFVPVVRDNSLPSSKKLPVYLGSALYIDMSSNNWKGEPLRKLVYSIFRAYKEISTANNSFHPTSEGGG